VYDVDVFDNVAETGVVMLDVKSGVDVAAERCDVAVVFVVNVYPKANA
jgi:hypothetical protein